MVTENFIWNNKNLVKILQGDGVVIMPTDTIYGIVGRAEDKNVVERIYKIRQRNPDKPCIILIGNINELGKFSVKISKMQKKVLRKYWPAPTMVGAGPNKATSIILDCPDKKFAYLHRGAKTLAFRMPISQELRDLLLKTGPLIAPSANLEARPPSETISEAKKYFDDTVDLYIDGGKITNKASKVIKLEKNGLETVLRE